MGFQLSWYFGDKNYDFVLSPNFKKQNKKKKTGGDIVMASDCNSISSCSITDHRMDLTKFTIYLSHCHAGLISLRKHAHSNILNILQPKKENFQIKILIFFILLLKT